VFEKYLRKTSRTLTEDEFLTVVEVGEEEGVLDEEERTMVDGIIGLEETQASDVMTPRVDLVGIDLDDPPTDSRALAASVTYRYLPVYRGSLDHPEGLLDVRQYLLSSAPDLTEAMIPAVFVPETAPLDTLLKQFQEENKRAALVADEYGGTAGLITRGDILEEIVADVENEYGETAHIPIQQLAADRWLVDGNTSLEDINDELETELEADGADRIAGWVAAQAEHIPRSGEVVEAQSCRATVQRVRRNRVTQVLLEKLGRSKRFNGERTIS
jgi:putative hemolysin